MGYIDHFFMPPQLPWDKPIMEYPLILRNEDGTKCITVFDERQEAEALPTYKRRAAWPPKPPPVVIGKPLMPPLAPPEPAAEPEPVKQEEEPQKETRNARRSRN